MSESIVPTPHVAEGQQEQAPDQPSFTPITSQDELNKVLKDRLERERGKFADYDELKSAAARLAEIEEANKSELQRASEAAQAAEARAAKAESDALRLRVAAKHGVSDEDADLFLTGTDEATLTRQAERLAQRAQGQVKRGNHAPNLGGTPHVAESEELQMARDLFGPS